MNDAASVIDNAVVTGLTLAVVVLALRLRAVSRRSRRFQREAEEANRTLAAFVSQSAEDFFRQDGGSR
jgi:hypothetical protein